jgi:tetratricopeptide (TPR) repeat protein
MEGVVLTLVCVSPWGFGSTATLFELLIDAGIALVLVLWATRIILLGQVTWKKCPVAVCLAALFLLGIWQLVPLGKPWLTALDPHAAQLYAQLLPNRPEVLPGGQEREPPPAPAGATPSLYPAATRAELVRLLGVLLLFAAVLNNISSPAALRRLSIVALANGALLALFGFVQYFSSPPHTVYWTYATPGNVFGPFINRNHFAWYVNLCVGLGLGLLAAPAFSRASAARAGDKKFNPEAGPQPEGHRRRRRRRGRHAPDPVRPGPASSAATAAGSHLDLLQDPRKLWILLPLTLMLCAVLFSASRGAFVAAGLAGLICLLLMAFRPRRFARLVPVLLVAVAAGAALLYWVGTERMTSRLATLGEARAAEASRLPLWAASLPLARDFPAWGTGLGTYTYVESLHRWDPREAGVVFEHAHNEYLELLIEGGIPGLVLGLAAAALALRPAWRACRRSESRTVRALALGALFALAATAAHAVVDFGLHIPAILLLVTVVAAQVAGLGAAAGRGEAAGGPGEYTLRLGGLAPLLAAAAAASLGLVLCGEGLKAHLVQRCRAAAADARQDEDDPDRRERAIAYLEQALAFAPEDASLRDELGRAHLEAIEAARQDSETASQVRDLLHQVTLPALLEAQEPFLSALVRVAAPADAAVGMPHGLLQGREDEAFRRHLVPGLRNCLLARDLCPLLSRPQVQLATYADRLAAGDKRIDYLRRATTLVPYDPELWFLSGVENLLDEQYDEAWADWRRSLELSPARLAPIVHACAPLLRSQEVMERVLPDKPELLYAAAVELYPDLEEKGLPAVDLAGRRPDYWAARLVLTSAGVSAGAAAPPLFAQELAYGYLPMREREPYLTRALGLLEQPPGPVEAKDFHTRAQVQWALWQPGAAEASYREALAREGLNPEWRYEYARLLHQLGKLKEARRELLIVLSLPLHPPEARQLLEEVTLERAISQDVSK